jgi:hypothetical protein
MERFAIGLGDLREARRIGVGDIIAKMVLQRPVVR